MVVAEASSRAVTGLPVDMNGVSAPPPETREALLDRVTELYAIQGRPCKACQVLLQYCKANDLKPDSLQPDLKARDMPDADGLAKVVQGVTDGLLDLSSDEGWQLVRDDELRLLYKAVPKSNVHCFRARCVLDAPTEHLVALAREVDLCPTWNKYCTSAHVLKEASPTDVTVYMSLYVPWPFNDVGFVVEANGADLYDEEGRLIIAFSSPDSKDSGVQLPPGAEKHRKVKLLSPSCMSFTPLPPKAPGGPQRTLCHVQTYVNPGISVPAFIISFVLKVLSPFVYGAVQKVLASAFKSPSGPLPSRLKQRELLYGLVKRRTEAYLAQQTQQQQQQQQQQDQAP
ncbi:hypothetical protein HYH02_007875 [Chlamydomonas schloesseri]|uniref:START domain-containing protein n=1 Tax=Chlamydomonas schloesseri TaxID=2026947 RepID=A0A836B4L4_9CHLO|nr:hypothetical protein HYH02_007875 [Chlamydomonas schloesseri]|eukprot:KAG2447129.1 hypothetical protein HYH02_007875 [Chlamydomonas schloesseri]